MAKSAATRAPRWTAKTAVCLRRSPTAPVRPSRPTTMTAECTMETESQTSFTGSQMSFQDKVRGVAPTDSLPSAVGLYCCALSMMKMGETGSKAWCHRVIH